MGGSLGSGWSDRGQIERFSFYEETGKVYAIIATGDGTAADEDRAARLRIGERLKEDIC